MPAFYDGYNFKQQTWAQMPAWQRKAWHRANETRACRGQAPLPKPEES